MVGTKKLVWLPTVLERFRRSMNSKISRDSMANNLSFKLPGFKYDDFDRAAFVSMVKINRMMETSRMGSLETSIAPGLGKLTFFMFGTSLQVSKQLYKTAALDYPMQFVMNPCNVGKSSIDAVQSFIGEETSAVLAQRIIRIVHVNPETRTALPIPEDVRVLLHDKVKSKQLRLPPFDIPVSIPKRHFVHEISVRFADLDHLFHSNQGSYLQYSFECAARAAAEGFYSQIREDICFYPGKMSSALHVAESFAGDLLHVLTWEDEANPLLLHFVIRKKEENVFYGKVEFYDRAEFID